MDFFTFDTAGDEKLLSKESEVIKSKILGISAEKEKPVREVEEESEEDEEDENKYDYGGLPPPSKDISHIIEKALAASNTKKVKEDKKTKSLNDFIESMGWNNDSKSSNKRRSQVSDTSVIDTSLVETIVDKELENSQLKGIEKKHAIECLSNRKAKEMRKQERSKTKGKDWFNMPATEISEEIENDLKILQMRSALDPKHFYKKNDLKVLPKYFQVGTVQHSPLDYYNERDTRRNKKRTIVDELMADVEFQRYNKRKYKEIMEKNQKSSYYKALKKMKKLKKKK